MLKHDIFNGPWNVKLDRKSVAKPKHYATYYEPKPLPNQINGWHVHHEFKDDYGDTVYGSINTRAGFDDTPDAEVICSGINSKGPDSIAIARHGNFFKWGFAATPKHMTQSGKDVFANAIVYTSKFDGQFPLHRRSHIGRDWWLHAAYRMRSLNDDYEKSIVSMRRYGRSESFIKASGPFEKYATRRLKQTFPILFEQLGVENLDRYFDEVVKHRDYLIVEEETPGKFFESPVIDEDCLAYGIANHDPRLLDHCISLLEKSTDTDRAKRVLARYTNQSFATAAQWRTWFESERDGLYFTDTGGYRFFTKGETTAERPGPTKRIQLRPVKFTAEFTPIADSPLQAKLTVRAAIDDSWYIYSRVPKGSSFAAINVRILTGPVEQSGEWEHSAAEPSSVEEGLMLFRNEAEVSTIVEAKDAADFQRKVQLMIVYQACDAARCLPRKTEFILVKRFGRD